MIEPYATTLRNTAQEFSKFGVSLVRNAEYAAEVSNGTYAIEVSADRYYHPGLSMASRDAMGKKFEIGLVQQILDPAHFGAAMAALEDVQERFGLDQPGMPNEVRLQGVLEYLQVMLAQILWFLVEHKERVFCSPNEYEADYALRASARVSQVLKEDLEPTADRPMTAICGADPAHRHAGLHQELTSGRPDCHAGNQRATM